MGGGLRLGSGAHLTDRGVRTGGALSGIVVRQIKMYIGEKTLGILLTIINFIFRVSRKYLTLAFVSSMIDCCII